MVLLASVTFEGGIFVFFGRIVSWGIEACGSSIIESRKPWARFRTPHS